MIILVKLFSQPMTIVVQLFFVIIRIIIITFTISTIPTVIHGFILTPFNRFPSLSSPFDSGKRCFNGFGCYARFPPSNQLAQIADAFHVGIYPESPQEVNVYFYLYTCVQPYRPTIIQWNVSDEELSQSLFDPNKRTIFIIHGFQDNYDEMNWMGVSLRLLI